MSDADDIRNATRRMVNQIDSLREVNGRQVSLINELEAQHQEDDRKLALLEARAVTDFEVAENVRKQLVWTQKELSKAEQIIAGLEVSSADELTTTKRRADAMTNAMQSQLAGFQEEIVRLKQVIRDAGL